MLNLTLCRTGDKRAFMSIFCALLEPETGDLEFPCAGHPYPLLRHAGGEIEELGTGGFPLGFRGDLEFETEHANLAPADTLVLFSDGIPEGVNSSGDSFGYERLQALVREAGSAQIIKERILLAFDEYVAEEPIHDNFSLVVLGRLPTGVVIPPPPP